MMQYENPNGTGGGTSFLFGMIVGAIAGAGVALLLAPKSGKELRSDLSESMTTLRDSASRRIQDLKDRASTGLSDLQAAAKSAAKPLDRTV